MNFVLIFAAIILVCVVIYSFQSINKKYQEDREVEAIIAFLSDDETETADAPESAPVAPAPVKKAVKKTTSASTKKPAAKKVATKKVATKKA